MHGDDFGLDAEIVELDLDEPRHGLERLGRVPAFLRRRIVEQRQGRQLVRLRRLEQRHLPFALEPFGRARADFDLLEQRLDARRGGLRSSAHLAHDFLPLLLGATAGPPDACFADPYVQLGEAEVDGTTRAIHDRDPRHARRERHGREPHHEQQHGGAEHTERVCETVADELPQDSAGRLAHARGREVQRREPGARRDREQEPCPPPDHRRSFRQFLAAEQKHARDDDEHGEQIRRRAEQHERDVGEPCAGRPHAIGDRVAAAGHAERGIDGAVAEQCQQQNHADARKQPERRFAQTADSRHEERLERAGLGFIQVARQ